jgi:2-isopropylmalate synthase
VNTIDIEELKKDMNFAKHINLFDTTLRDGEQSPGIALTPDEKIQIAKKLDNLGINTIEMGFPIVSEGERETARKLQSLNLNAELCGLSRALKKDVDAVLDSDLSYMHTFIGTSPLHRDYKLKMSKEEILEKTVNTIEYGKDHGLTVEFSAEDATRTEFEFLLEIYNSAEEAHVDIINIPDTVGILVPITTRELIKKLKKDINTPMSVHFHNDFGLAVANSIIAIEEGVQQAHLTVNGIGERGGNTSLEEFIMALKIGYGINLDVDTTQLYNLSDFISQITGFNIAPNKPIVGKNAFAHEAGIHVQGIIENTATYEPIPPELVGQSRKIALGKHTGVNALKSKLSEFHLNLNEEEFYSVYNQIKKLGDKGKTLTDADVKSIAITELSTAQEEAIKLLGLTVVSGESVSATATVKLLIDEEIRETSEIGVGPIDAALNAIKSLVQEKINISLEDYHLGAITGGTDALAEVFVITSDENGNKATGRATNDDVIMASVIAVINSINKIIFIKKNSKINSTKK